MMEADDAFAGGGLEVHVPLGAVNALSGASASCAVAVMSW